MILALPIITILFYHLFKETDRVQEDTCLFLVEVMGSPSVVLLGQSWLGISLEMARGANSVFALERALEALPTLGRCDF